MFTYSVFIFTIIVYLFALVNAFWLKLSINPLLSKYLKATHFILIVLILFPIIASIYLDSFITYAGYYTLPIIFWGALISGFLFFAFGFRNIKNILLRSYFFILQFMWLVLAVTLLVTPLLGALAIYMLKPLAQPHGRTVYSNNEYRIDEIGSGAFMAPQYKKLYYLVEKGSLLETKTSFSIDVEVDEMPTVKSATITASDNNKVLATIEFEENIIINDSTTSKKITKEISIK